MADTKISALTVATTPLAGTEVLPIVQSGVTKQVSVANLTAGRAVSADSLTLTGSPLAATSGGTGQSSYAVGDLLYASTTTALSKLADVATGNALISGGVGVAPSWGKIGLTTHVSGTLAVGNGGTGITTTPTNGQIPIGNGTNYTAATLTAGGGIGITNASGSVTIATSSPTFSAYGNAAQTLTAGVYTKAVLNAEDYDTNNNFDSTTNYRFTPTVAGYYQLNLKLSAASTTSLTRIIADFRKNGSGANNGRCLDIGVNLGSFDILSASNLMYFNGSTDYCEIWVYLDGVGTLTISSNDKNTTFFQGSMIRAA